MNKQKIDIGSIVKLDDFNDFKTVEVKRITSNGVFLIIHYLENDTIKYARLDNVTEIIKL